MKKVSFARIVPVINVPQLLEMQTDSYAKFLQADVEPEKRLPHGLQAAFLDIFPVINTYETLCLEFAGYNLGAPRYTYEECLEHDATYAAPMKAKLRLVATSPGNKPKLLTDQEVYICDLPIMTETASFVINGAERVVVSQLHRSPGVIFEEDREKKISSYGKKLFFARIIPYRGAWIEFEFDLANVLYVRIDKKRKLPATVLLRACGIETNAQILSLFYESETLDLAHDSGAALGRILASEVVETGSGEIIAEPNQEITKELLLRLEEKKAKSLKVLVLNPSLNDVTIRNTLAKDQVKSRKEALNLLYRTVRSQEFVVPEQAETYLDVLLFKSIQKYDLTKVGRFKINRKLLAMFHHLGKRKDIDLEIPNERKRTLTLADIISTMQYVIMLNNGVSSVHTAEGEVKIEIDDIDHLGNRRVRGIGELLENQVRVGLAQMARHVREKMNLQEEIAGLTPRMLLNTAPVVAIVRKFFGSSQLSQFMDQTNPMSELTHKRRLSALGPGGLHRKHAGFEVRDVHHTHYGRICPIETPEGPNIGLITSLACYARVNEYGLIESPYLKVVSGRVTDEIEYLTADKENEYVVAQANAPVDKSGRLAADLIACRHRGDFPMKGPEDIQYMDISPMQVISVSTALIPFLEHDDANRALMGSNMQRQGVPLLITESPLVATGIEGRVAKDSGAVVMARQAGKVVAVSSNEIAIYSEDDNKSGAEIHNYKLRKYGRSNQDTCLNQVPIVEPGQYVKKNEVIADGCCTSGGELALGRNLLVAFMPWEGYNFEDAMLLSERLIREEIFTSIHIQEFQIEARDTKMGPEEITRDIPNVSAESLINLDENGIIRIGADVSPGNILVGKVAPKGDQQMTPEERLLKVIFGKKAEDVMDVSLRVPPGVRGSILMTRVFSRKEKLTRKEENQELKDLEKKQGESLQAIKVERKVRLDMLKDQHEEGKINKHEYDAQVKQVQAYAKQQETMAHEIIEREKENLRGDELPVTVNRIVKVYIATRRKVQVGDKLAGRHGNKGVVSKILAPEDMPHMPDGTPVDVVLSPLSVPSRMNVGQILETILGWAAHGLGIQAVTPVFDGATEEQVRDMIRQAKEKLRKEGVPEKYLPTDDCTITLYDGRTGEPFAEKVLIGYMYMMKLAHMVEDKIHARSTGPYSLITRQPLGGKAQFGGQRFGEMEVWAIEGYGGAYTLQEFLTVKSDDVAGRTKMYEAIISGKSLAEPGVPESFKVLVRELQALGLNVELFKANGGKTPSLKGSYAKAQETEDSAVKVK